MLIETIFVNIQAQATIKVKEEDASHVVSLVDDDGILRGECSEIGKRRTEHRMRRDITHASLFVEILQSCLYRSDVRDDAILREAGNNLLEDLDCILQCDSIDDEFGLEVLYLVERREALRVIEEPHPSGINLIDGTLMIE